MTSTRLQAQKFVFGVDSPWGRFHVSGGHDYLIDVLYPGIQPRSDLMDGETSSLSSDWMIARAAEFLKAYFRGEKAGWQEPVMRNYGTPFQIAVWEALQAIPFGHTVSYRTISSLAGKPRAARAAANAVAYNFLPIIIPCHRVIGSDGSLRGYGGGLDLKRALLRHEGVDV